MMWLAEYSTHRSSSRGLAPGFRKKKVASSAPVLELGTGGGPFVDLCQAVCRARTKGFHFSLVGRCNLVRKSNSTG